MPNPLFQVRLFSADNAGWRNIPAIRINSAQWHITRQDGYAEATLTLNGLLSDFSGLVRGRRIEFWGRDASGALIRLYRGYVAILRGEKVAKGSKRGSGKQAAQSFVSLLGIWSRRGQLLVKQRYAWPAGIDAGTAFAIIANKWAKSKDSSLVINGGVTGQTIDAIDAWRKSLSEVADSIADSMGGFAITGGDVDPSTGADRIYLRSFESSTTPSYSIPLPDPARNVTQYDTDTNASGIINSVDLIGGQHRFPNLLAEAVQGNTSFEYPTYISGETTGDLITDGGFENETYSSGESADPVTLTDVYLFAPGYNRTLIKSRSYIFSQYDVGRSFLITAGTGWITGTYRVTAVNFGRNVPDNYATLDRIPVSTNPSTDATGTLSAIDAWTLENGASRVTGGGNYGATNGGNYMILLPSATSKVNKPFGPDPSKITVGKTYQFQADIRLEKNTPGDIGLKARLRVHWLNAGGTAIGSDTVADFDNAQGLVSNDQFLTFSLKSICPTDVTNGDAVKGVATVELFYKPGTATGGLLVDNLSMFDLGGIVQPGWELVKGKPDGGSGVINAVDWALEMSRDVAVHGAYGVQVAVTASDNDNDDIVFRPLNNAAFTVQPNQKVRFAIYVKTPTGSTANLPKLDLRISEYKADDSFVGETANAINLGTSQPAFTQFTVSHTMTAAAAKARVAVRIRASGSVVFDAAEARDFAASQASDNTYIEGSNFVKDVGANTTILFPDPSDPVNGSIAEWGEIPEADQNDNITTETDAASYLRALFRSRALPIERPPLEITGKAIAFWPGQYMRAIGADAPVVLPYPLPIMEVEGEYTTNGLLKLRPVLGTERSTEARVTRDIVRRELRKSGQSGSGTGYSTPSAGSGVGGSSGGDIAANGIRTVADEGTALTYRDTINFTGAGVTAADDSGNGRINVSIPGYSPSGFSGTITIPKLTTGGNDGLITFTNGIATAATDPT